MKVVLAGAYGKLGVEILKELVDKINIPANVHKKKYKI